jgi:hypothetical protein
MPSTIDHSSLVAIPKRNFKNGLEIANTYIKTNKVSAASSTATTPLSSSFLILGSNLIILTG